MLQTCQLHSLCFVDLLTDINPFLKRVLVGPSLNVRKLLWREVESTAWFHWRLKFVEFCNVLFYNKSFCCLVRTFKKTLVKLPLKHSTNVSVPHITDRNSGFSHLSLFGLWFHTLQLPHCSSPILVKLIPTFSGEQECHLKSEKQA